MKLIQYIRNIFTAPTILSSIEVELPLEEAKIKQCEDMIQRLQYEISLSEAKMVAMLNWREAHNPAYVSLEAILEKERKTHDDHSSY